MKASEMLLGCAMGLLWCDVGSPDAMDNLKGSVERLVDQSLRQTAGAPTRAKGDKFSSASVWSSVNEDERWTAWQGCFEAPNRLDCILARMNKSGASEDSMNFVKEFSARGGGDGWLNEFQERGRVDLGLVNFPYRANTNEMYVLLNGTPSFVSTELSQDLDITRDQYYPQLKKLYPELFAWGAGARFQSVQAASDGGQRFLFSYILVNGCHACYVEWTVEVAFDFRSDGKFLGTKVLRLVKEKSDGNATPASSKTVCEEPRDWRSPNKDTLTKTPTCVNTPDGPVRKDSTGCYVGNAEYNARIRRFSDTVLGPDRKGTIGCLTYPYLGDAYHQGPNGKIDPLILNKFHAGIDLRGNGEVVRALASGRVFFNNYVKGDTHSTLIVETLDNSRKIVYLHMKDVGRIDNGKFQRPWKVGDFITKGQRIGHVSNINPFLIPPHLHVEVWPAGSDRYDKTSAIWGCDGGKCSDTQIKRYTIDPTSLSVDVSATSMDDKAPEKWVDELKPIQRK